MTDDEPSTIVQWLSEFIRRIQRKRESDTKHHRQSNQKCAAHDAALLCTIARVMFPARPWHFSVNHDCFECLPKASQIRAFSSSEVMSPRTVSQLTDENVTLQIFLSSKRVLLESSLL
jgi:hypothetical protein